ncbi:MAG TPA: thermonuclease family protein [Candidatus Nanoarchaeia archaeon]|nr:thermonuclease family protein [Candidatus Nanoarchaeia archaeon]
MKNIFLILLILLVTSCTFKEEIKTENATVKEIIDGDTYLVDINGTEEKVRILGVDYPDVTKSRMKNFLDLNITEIRIKECYKKGKIELQNNLVGKKVILKKDPKESNRDKYKRLLRYVEINNTDVETWLLKNGYARFYDPNKELCSKCIDYYILYENVSTSKTGCLWSES